jgi:hypothetical protein
VRWELHCLNVISTKIGLFSQLHHYKMIHVGFEMLTAVVMKCSVFWNITPYSPLKVNGRLRLQGWRIGIVELSLISASCWFIAWLILRPRRWRRYSHPKRWLTFDGPHGVISKKLELFIKWPTSYRFTFFNSKCCPFSPLYFYRGASGHCLGTSLCFGP